MPLNKPTNTDPEEMPALTLVSARRRKVPFQAKLETDQGMAQFSGHFNPRVYTPVFLERLRETPDNDTRAWARLLCGSVEGMTGGGLLVDLDGLPYGAEDAADGLCKPEEVGKPIPIEEERLAALPLELLTAISQGIAESGRPKPTTAPSENGSMTSSFQEDESGPLLVTTDSPAQSGGSMEQSP